MRDNLILFIYAIPAILISLSFHEMSHAYVSYLHGDPTAKRLGRLTMNPLKHLDHIGTLVLVVSMFSSFGFGWAKPVPINPSYYRNKKRGTIMVSLAGPLSNLLLAFLFSLPMAIIAIISGISASEIYNGSNAVYGVDYSILSIIFNISRFFYLINIGLAIFNILPIPPLDGSRILTAVLPEKAYFGLMRYERYIGFAFLALMIIKPGILTAVMGPFRRAIEAVFRLMASPVTGLFG